MRESTISNLLFLLQKPQEYVNKHFGRKAIINKDILTTHLFDYSLELFKFVSHTGSSSSLFSESTFICLKSMIGTFWKGIPFFEEKITESPVVEILATHLFTKLGQKNTTPSIQLFHANNLMRNNKYEEAERLYKTVLGNKPEYDNDWQIPPHYNMFAYCLLKQMKYKEARQVFKYILEIDDSLIHHWNLAYANITCENYDNYVLDTMKRIVEMSPEEKKQHDINPLIAKYTYQYALEKAGKTEELSILLLAEQAKALEKALKRDQIQAARINNFREETTKQQQERQRINAQSQRSTPSHKLKTTTPISTSDSLLSHEYKDFYYTSKEEKYTIIQPNEKKKTKKKVEKYRLGWIFGDLSQENFKQIEPGELVFFSKGPQLYCKTKHQPEMELKKADKNSEAGLKEELYDKIMSILQERMIKTYIQDDLPQEAEEQEGANLERGYNFYKGSLDISAQDAEVLFQYTSTYTGTNNISESMDEKQKATSKPLRCLESLTSNKNAWKTFEKFFTLHQRKNCFNNEVNISLHEFNSLCKALHQKVDPSQGKGSHTKVTLSLGSEMEEQMIILTNKTHLPEFIIKEIREAFAKERLVPHDPEILQVLKDDGLLED